MNNINDICIAVVKDFPDDIILLLSGEIDLGRLDEEVKMKKIIGVRIENE